MLGVLVGLVLGLIGGAGGLLVLVFQKFQHIQRLSRTATSIGARNERRQRELDDRESRLKASHMALTKEREAFQSQVITYEELRKENAILKRDVRNVDLSIRKAKLDVKLQGEVSARIDDRASELAKRWLRDNLKWIESRLSTSNYPACKQRLIDVIDWCREVGYDISAEEEEDLLQKLQSEYEHAVRRELEREEQAQIKAQIREEARMERERNRELEQAEADKRRIQAALDAAVQQALQEAQEKHSAALDQQAAALGEHAAEIEQLRANLAEAMARAQRAVSMAQLTRAGHVYVISNIGSFGEGVFKVGMTRRLIPLDRIRELGDASVPFSFDVHMMISCADAPALENALHRELHRLRVNPLNPKKEFFRTDIETIRQLVEKHHGVVEYVADPEALEYRQSLNLSPEDRDFIEQVYEAVAEEEGDEILEEEPAE